MNRFINPAAAKEALEKMNGFDLANRPIRVGLGNDRFTNESTQNLLQYLPSSRPASSVPLRLNGARDKDSADID